MTRPEIETNHNTDYRVYMAEESCTCVCPEEDSTAWAAWDDEHPRGEGVSGWEGRICNKTVMGTFCEECSDEQGDWCGHMVMCRDCEYTLEDDGTCQCDPAAAPDPLAAALADPEGHALVKAIHDRKATIPAEQDWNF